VRSSEATRAPAAPSERRQTRRLREDPPAPSVDQAAPVTELSPSEQREVCDWVHLLDRREFHECAHEPVIVEALDFCAYGLSETCALTFMQLIACAETLRECSDVDDPPEPCRAVFNCYEPPTGQQ
jgi:hypothetical protein